jgi:hypothetical protein
LQSQRALEVLPAMQAAPQDKMALQQCAGIAKDLQYFVLSHHGKLGTSFGGDKQRVSSLFSKYMASWKRVLT